MKSVSIGRGIVPLHEFKAHAGRWLRRLREDQEPFVITHNGRPAGVVVSPEDYDEIVRQREFDREIAAAEADVESGNVYTSDELRAQLDERRRARAE